MLNERILASRRVYPGGPRAWRQSRQFRLFAHRVGRAHQMNITFRLLFRGRVQLDQLGHPIIIHRGAAAIARQQRSGHARNAGEEDFIERLFQHIQASNADDGINMAADDDFQDDRCPLGDKNLVAQLLRLHLEIGHRASPALFTIQAKLIVVGGAAFRVLETVRQQQESPRKGDALHLFAPELVADGDHRETEILIAQGETLQQSGGHRTDLPW